MPLFVFANSKSITIQGIYKSIKFEKYIYGVRAWLGYSVSGTSIKTFLDTVWPSGEDVGKFIKFLDTIGFDKIF